MQKKELSHKIKLALKHAEESVPKLRYFYKLVIDMKEEVDFTNQKNNRQLKNKNKKSIIKNIFQLDKLILKPANTVNIAIFGILTGFITFCIYLKFMQTI